MKIIDIKGFDEKIYYDICDNGLPIYMHVNDKVNNFYITLSVRYGSVDTEFCVKGDKKYVKVPDGIAHFLEHVNFNEGDNETAHDYFNNLGSSINAFTTFDYTCYEVFASNEFEKNLTHLLDYVQKPYFTDKLISKEKGIICEEVKMGKNNPAHELYYKSNEALLKNDKRKYLVTGEIKDVKETTTKQLEMVYNHFYCPSNMVLVITGNFKPEQAVAIVKENQAGKNIKNYEMDVKNLKEPLSVNQDYVEIKANVEIPKLKISYKLSKKDFGKMDPRELMIYLNVIIRNNFGSTSEIREDLLEQELVTSLSFGCDIFKDLITIKIVAESKYPKEVIKILKDKMNNLVLTEEDINRRKRANIAAIIDEYDDIESVNLLVQEQIIKDNELNTKLFEIINGLNMKKAKMIMGKMNLTHNSTAVLVPNKK